MTQPVARVILSGSLWMSGFTEVGKVSAPCEGLPTVNELAFIVAAF
jgi:hypothetical protein